MNDLPPIDDRTPSMPPEDRRLSQESSLRRLRPPLKIAGYEQEEFIGRGAFGEVWSAIDSNSGRRVAIKFYSRRGALDWSNMAREVEKLRFLFTDRYVVQLLQVGWDADPPYFVMEYMSFGSLADLLHRGALPVDDAVKLFKEIALGLAHAHGKGVLHCDLKPNNIMLDQDGKPRLADFGQSRLRHEHAPSLGTFFYMAPEQADPESLPDVRWDVYGLGAILYQMVVGKAPHQTEELLAELSSRDTLQTRLDCYRQSLKKAPKPTEHRRVRGMDSALASIIDRCLALNPRHRYSNVQALLEALKQRDTRRAQRPMLLLGALGPAVVVLLMAAISLWLFRDILATAERQLIGRTLESNGFAAHLVGARFSLEIDKRWRVLERAASDPQLHRLLKQAAQEGDGSETHAALARWIETQRKAGNAQFSASLAASNWYLIDRQGRMQAISPPSPNLIGEYFGYRDYFHGRGDEPANKRDAPKPIREPHRSNIYLSKPENMLAVAFSTPILDAAGGRNETLGVLVMEADLGHFAEFAGARHQFAAIVDLRPDETGKRGLIGEHPALHGRNAESERFYVAPPTLERLERLRAEHAARVSGQNVDLDVEQQKKNALGQFEFYHDPLEPDGKTGWLCGAEPVFVARSGHRVYDSGWCVLVEERQREVLAPLHDLWGLVVRGGLAALALVVLVLTGLWIYVLVRLHVADDARRFVRRLVGMTGTAGGPSERISEMSGSMSATAGTAGTSEHKSAGGEHG
ncbi:MAG TPA: serine/threonine protein kinase [Pirellulales bacterium]|nr:serine/threonine protein kinase [Pirellulales bacterium]